MTQRTMDDFIQDAKTLRIESQDICKRIIAEVNPDLETAANQAKLWARRMCLEIISWHDNPRDVPNPETSSTDARPTVTHGTRELGEKRGYAPGEFFL